MNVWKHHVSLDELNHKSKNSLIEQLGIEFIEIGSTYLKARMPIDHRTLQPMGILHGGASCALIETIASIAANCTIDFTTEYCVGIALHANHIRSVKEEFVTAIATAAHLGKTTQVWEVKIFDSKEKLICLGNLTIAVLQRKPLQA